MAETTKQDVADYINSIDENMALEEGEWAVLQEKIDPQLAKILIKLVGDVWWLAKIRENESNDHFD
tara:strand:- start:39 stop:236 length:198 start_codon:yes stop_codon:yes gene_type:complete